MRLVTWNVNSLRARFAHLSRITDEYTPDLIALQETKVRDEEFPADDVRGLGYDVTFSGQKSYNGVAVLTRSPVSTFATALPGFETEEKRVLGVETEEFRLLNLYVPNGSSVGSEKYEFKMAWLNRLVAWIGELSTAAKPLIVVGDFNIAPADIDVHDPDAWHEKILCSSAERKHLEQLLALGFDDLYRVLNPDEPGFSWWDYRAGGFRRNHGLRIDLILTASTITTQMQTCEVLAEPRTWEKPSDHAPVCATLG